MSREERIKAKEASTSSSEKVNKDVDKEKVSCSYFWNVQRCLLIAKVELSGNWQKLI